MNNLLSDLFSGLQAELGGSSSADMPCQLLKCLEDKHNWDRSSIVKTNLKNYFSHLLLGELDIAITNSIEKYHARVCNLFNKEYIFSSSFLRKQFYSRARHGLMVPKIQQSGLGTCGLSIPNLFFLCVSVCLSEAPYGSQTYEPILI